MNPHIEERLRRELAALPDLATQAATTLAGEHLGGETKTRTVPGSRPPLQLDVAALTTRRNLDRPDQWPIRDGGIIWTGHKHGRTIAYTDDELPGGILAVLAAWTRHAEADMLDAHHAGAWRYSDPTPLADQPTITTEVRWLLRHIVWILDQPWADMLAHDIHKLTRDCEQALRVRPVYQPRCPIDGCGGTIRDQGAAGWRCDTCDRTTTDRRLDLRTAIVHQQPMTAAELARAFGWSIKTIESWIRRGNLTPADDSRPRRYHITEALRLADQGGTCTTTTA